MAQTSNLREFQEGILLRLKEATSAGAAESTSRLGVIIGGKQYLVNLSEVKEVLPVPPLQAVPLTKPWYLGVSNIRGNLYSVSDLAMFMENTPTIRSANNRILLLNADSVEQVAILIERLVGLRNVDAMQVNKAADHLEQFYSNQLYMDAEGNDWYALEIELLMQNKEFFQPSH